MTRCGPKHLRTTLEGLMIEVFTNYSLSIINKVFTNLDNSFVPNVILPLVKNGHFSFQYKNLTLCFNPVFLVVSYTNSEHRQTMNSKP